MHISGLQSERVHVLQWADAHETDLSDDEAERSSRKLADSQGTVRLVGFGCVQSLDAQPANHYRHHDSAKAYETNVFAVFVASHQLNF